MKRLLGRLVLAVTHLRWWVWCRRVQLVLRQPGVKAVLMDDGSTLTRHPDDR